MGTDATAADVVIPTPEKALKVAESSQRLNPRARKEFTSKLEGLVQSRIPDSAEIFLDFLLTGTVPEGKAETVRSYKERARKTFGLERSFREPGREAVLAALRDLSKEDIAKASKPLQNWINQACNGRILDLNGKPLDGKKLFTNPAQPAPRKKQKTRKKRASNPAPPKAVANKADQDFKALYLCIDTVFAFSCRGGPRTLKPQWDLAHCAFTKYIEGTELASIKDTLSQENYAVENMSMGEFKTMMGLCIVMILSLHNIKIEAAKEICETNKIPLQQFMLYCTQLAYSNLPQQSEELGDISDQKWPQKYVLDAAAAEACKAAFDNLNQERQKREASENPAPQKAKPSPAAAQNPPQEASGAEPADDPIDKIALKTSVNRYLASTSAHTREMLIGIVIDGKNPKDFLGRGFLSIDAIEQTARAILANRFKITAKFAQNPDGGLTLSPPAEEIMATIDKKLSAERQTQLYGISQMLQRNKD